MADPWIAASGNFLLWLALFAPAIGALLMALWGVVETIEVDER